MELVELVQCQPRNVKKQKTWQLSGNEGMVGTTGDARRTLDKRIRHDIPSSSLSSNSCRPRCNATGLVVIHNNLHPLYDCLWCEKME